MNRMVIITTMLFSIASVSVADERNLFTFDKPGSAKQWQTINDGVMGGRSDGRFRINEDSNLEFYGTLSLENNGGFASVRARDSNLVLKNDDVIVVRVKGDVREYNFNVYDQPNLGGFSFR